jgi:DNA-binding NarL/FixJ family response regulator
VIRVVVADDNAVLRQGLAAVLAHEPDIDLVAVAADGREAVAMAGEHAPDVVLLDIRMPVMDGLDATRRLVPRYRVLMLTYSDEDEMVVAAMQAGANGYLVYGETDPSEVGDAIRRVHRGQTVIAHARTAALVRALQHQHTVAPTGVDEPAPLLLTPREEQLLALAADGMTNAEIAETLVLSVRTVRNHMSNVYQKLDVRSRTEAVAWWLTTPGAQPV